MSQITNDGLIRSGTGCGSSERQRAKSDYACVYAQFFLVTDLQSRNGRRCLRVQRGDRLGVYFDHDASALSYRYRYTTDPSQLKIAAHIFSNVSYPVADSNERVPFENIVYPYDFLVEAYYYTGKKIIICRFICIFII